MTTPGQAVNAKISLSKSASQVAADNSYSSHTTVHSFLGDASNPLAVLEFPELPLPDPADLASTEKTRAALLKLCDSPRDTVALAALWDENRPSIEHELQRHLCSNSNSALLQELLARLVWHARFFCDEVDHPKDWIARCANLEARRLALQLTEAR